MNAKYNGEVGIMSKNNAFIMNLRKIGKDLKKEGAIQKQTKIEITLI